MNIASDSLTTAQRLRQVTTPARDAKEMLWAMELSHTLKSINLSKPHFDPALNLWGLETLLYVHQEPGQDAEHYARIAERPVKAIEGQLRQIAGMKRGMPVVFPYAEYRKGEGLNPGGWFLTEMGSELIRNIADTCVG